MSAIDRRASGILLHISSLYGDYSVGSFGKAAYEFIDFLADAGYTYWQVLPFCIPDDCNSPYKSLSAFAGNPYFIDLPLLFEEGLLTREELIAAQQTTPYAMEGDRLSKEREALLRKAASRAKNKAEISAFIAERQRLAEACLFLALKDANDGKVWQEWQITEPDADNLFYYHFTQYKFCRQWAAVKEYANKKGVRIIGDMPIYVAADSADVYFNREEFQLDKQGYPSSVAGVPPDYFAEDGQLWGNPLYRWDKMKQNNFRWWRERMAYTLEMFDGVRIDHFRGIESYWSVPAAAKTAREGKFRPGPRMTFVRAMREVAGDRLIIAEDLGDITPAVKQLLAQSGFPGMRVFQFAFLGDPCSPHLPHTYEHNSVAYTGTHDNNTLLGYVWEMEEENRRHMLTYCGYTDQNWDRGYDAILRTMLQSHAGLVIFPIQDILGFGADTRINIPGKADGNWCYRITREQLFSLDRAALRAQNQLYGRI